MRLRQQACEFVGHRRRRCLIVFADQHQHRCLDAGEFWPQVDQALDHTDKGWKLEKKIVRDDAQKTLTLAWPYTEPGKDAWAEQLSYHMALNIFTVHNIGNYLPNLLSYPLQLFDVLAKHPTLRGEVHDAAGKLLAGGG